MGSDVAFNIAFLSSLDKRHVNSGVYAEKPAQVAKPIVRLYMRHGDRFSGVTIGGGAWVSIATVGAGLAGAAVQILKIVA